MLVFDGAEGHGPAVVATMWELLRSAMSDGDPMATKHSWGETLDEHERTGLS